MAVSDECFMWFQVNQVHIETLPGALPSIKTFPRSCQAIFVCLSRLQCAVAPQQYTAHLICFYYRGSAGLYLFHSRRLWAVYSTCTSLSSLPSATYLFITDSSRKVLSWQTPDFIKRREGDGQADTSGWLCSVMGDIVSMNSVLPGVKADLQRRNLAKALWVNERVQKKGGKHFHFH